MNRHPKKITIKIKKRITIRITITTTIGPIAWRSSQS
jgi:hypothetical protein